MCKSSKYLDIPEIVYHQLVMRDSHGMTWGYIWYEGHMWDKFISRLKLRSMT